MRKMRRFSKRQESVRLKSSPARSFVEYPLGSPSSYSMVDFHISSRPPRRRYSLQSDVGGAVEERRLGRSEADDSVKRTRRKSLWSGLRFWEASEEMINRKPADDFFDDIFRGNQSDGGTKMMRSDASSHCDSSAPPQFSVLADMSNRKEVHSPGRSTDYYYPLSPAVLSSKPSRQGSPNLTHRTNEGDLTYHRRQVFVQFSLSNDGSVKISKTEKLEAEEILKPNSVSSDSLGFADVASDLPEPLIRSKNIVDEISDVGKAKGMVAASSRFGSHIGKGTISETSVTSSPEVSGRKKSVKEMVKEFVEMFNKESSSKSKIDAETLSQRSERNDKGCNKGGGGVNVSAKKGGKGVPNHNLDDNEMFEIELKPPNTQKNLSSASLVIVEKPQVLDSSSTDEKKTSSATSTKVDLPDEKKMEPPSNFPKVDGHEEHEKQDSCKEQGIHVYKYTPLKHANASSSGSLLDIYQDANESFFDPVFPFEIKELTQEQKMAAQTDEYQQALQDSDEKIRRWSSGKEGNIRSLLSTLQHVMWPGSGWKPVALTDIIEENQVKKTYQRALLCVHPDKLKQKSVGEVERYIGEKVFKILQEAWNFFNTLTPL